METPSKLASAFKAIAEALGLSVKMEEETPAPVGYVLTSQDGTEINIDKPEGEDPAVGDAATPDGEHLMPDGTTIVIADGVITEIRDAEQEEPETPEEPEVEEPEEKAVDLEAINAAHAEELAAKDAEIAQLQARIADLEAGQMSAEQSEILAIVDKAGGKAWLDKSTQSNYKPATRSRNAQTVEPAASKTASDLAEAKAARAAKRAKVVRNSQK